MPGGRKDLVPRAPRWVSTPSRTPLMPLVARPPATGGDNVTMRGLRGEEMWVAACVEAALPTVEVCQHDDGSTAGMYDLAMFRDDALVAAVEVTAAADGESIALWNLMNGGHNRWQEADLVGGWFVTLHPSARAKALRRHLPDLLRELERAGQTELWTRSSSSDSLSSRAVQLGVTRVHQSGTEFAGSVYVTIELPHERSGGMVASTGDALAHWLERWVREPEQSDNLTKLERSGVRECHLFVLVPGFTTAPFPAVDLLLRDAAPLPTIPILLPPPVSHIWTMSTWSSGDVFRWCAADGWRRSKKDFDIEAP